MKENKNKFDFEYSNINDLSNLMNYCVKCDVSLNSFEHTKMKNIITNQIYISEELSELEKIIFLFLYDFKSQQKYLPGIVINQKQIGNIIGKSKGAISKAIKNLEKYNLLILSKDIFGNDIFIPNENTLKWGTTVDLSKLNNIELHRKIQASYNKQLTEEYKLYKSKNINLV